MRNSSFLVLAAAPESTCAFAVDGVVSNSVLVPTTNEHPETATPM